MVLSVKATLLARSTAEVALQLHKLSVEFDVQIHRFTSLRKQSCPDSL